MVIRAFGLEVQRSRISSSFAMLPSADGKYFSSIFSVSDQDVQFKCLKLKEQKRPSHALSQFFWFKNGISYTINLDNLRSSASKEEISKLLRLVARARLCLFLKDGPNGEFRAKYLTKSAIQTVLRILNSRRMIALGVKFL